MKRMALFPVKWYTKSRDAQAEFDKDLQHLIYISSWGIAESLQDPLLLASIKFDNGKSTIKKKLDFVARFIETFTVKRAVNFKKFGQTSI